MVFSDDARLDEMDRLLAAARWGAADRDEVLAVSARVVAGDATSWLREWTAAGGDAWAAANERPTATDYLRGASYYAAALAAVAASDGSVDRRALHARLAECWARAAALLGAEMVRLACDGVAVTGWLFRAAPARRPLAIVDVGAGRPPGDAWAGGGAAAHGAGHHWLAVATPALLPHPEGVLSAVLDAMRARRDVEPERIGLIGRGVASFSAARALTAEHRFASAVLAPGVHDLSAPWRDALAEAQARRFAPETTARLRSLAAAYGLADRASYAAYARMRGYRLGDEVAQITTPLVVGEGSRRWPGQARELFDRLRGPKQLVPVALLDAAIAG
jgi:hypothetical protein